MVYDNPDKIALYNFKVSDILRFTNLTNKTKYTDKQFTYSAPRCLEIASGKTGLNTEVDMIPAKKNGIPNLIKVQYDRIPTGLICYAFGGGVEVPATCTDTYSIFPYIAEYFGVIFYPEDFVNYPIRWDANDDKNHWVTIKAKTNSLIYINSTQLKIYKKSPSIRDLGINTKLNDFKQILPKHSDKIDVSNILYNYDCDWIAHRMALDNPEYREYALKGVYNHITEWKGITSETANLFNNPYSDVIDPNKIDLRKIRFIYRGPTSGYVGSNPKFKSVDVYDIGDQPHFTGKLFFHNNLEDE